MKFKNQISGLITGGSIVIIGVLLLSSLVGIVESASIYLITLPMLLILSGILLLNKSDRYKLTVALSLISVGAISLLVSLNIIQGYFINGILGITLLYFGANIIAKSINKSDKDHKLKNIGKE